LGSIVAYTVNGLFVGWEPLFQVPSQLGVRQFSDYAWYALLGLSGGIVGTILPNLFYYTRDLFHKIPIPPHFKPAIGGLGVGIIGLVLPQVLGGGYGWIQEVINGRFTITLLLFLLLGKMVAFALTVGSGGSGGVFAPSLFVGAMLGGLLAHLFHQPAAAFAVVGMAAVFGSAGRVPFATLLMVTEMTGGYNLLVPAALAVMLGYLVQSTLSAPLKYKSLYESQVISRAESPAHRIENLKTALKILSQHQKFDPSLLEHVDLMALLQSGLPVDLPGGKQLFILTLRPGSPQCGIPVQQSCVSEGEEWEIVAIFRGEQLMLPSACSLPQAGDQFLVMTSPAHLEKLKKKF
jgi:CIC family chloride channel protein